MSSEISTMALIGFFVLVIATFGSVSGLEPKLLDVTAIVCPAQKPYICLPYGVCCEGDQFCFQGSCESCFPADVSEESLLKWCQEKGLQDVSLMRHHSCALACYARFNASVLPTHKVTEEVTSSASITIVLAATASVIFIQFVVIGILIKCLVCPGVKKNTAREESPKPVETSNELNERREHDFDQSPDTPMDRMRALRQLSIPEVNEETIPLRDIIINP